METKWFDRRILPVTIIFVPWYEVLMNCSDGNHSMPYGWLSVGCLYNPSLPEILWEVGRKRRCCHINEEKQCSLLHRILSALQWAWSWGWFPDTWWLARRHVSIAFPTSARTSFTKWLPFIAFDSSNSKLTLTKWNKHISFETSKKLHLGWLFGRGDCDLTYLQVTHPVRTGVPQIRYLWAAFGFIFADILLIVYVVIVEERKLGRSEVAVILEGYLGTFRCQ